MHTSFPDLLSSEVVWWGRKEEATTQRRSGAPSSASSHSVETSASIRLSYRDATRASSRGRFHRRGGGLYGDHGNHPPRQARPDARLARGGPADRRGVG